MSRKVLACSAGRGSHMLKARVLQLDFASSRRLFSTTRISSRSAYSLLGAAKNRRCFSNQPSHRGQAGLQTSESADGVKFEVQLAHKAKQKLADKEFFFDLLSSAATKRDAKAYLSRLKQPTKTASKPHTPSQRDHILPRRSARPEVNLGNFFGHARAVDESPVFTQYKNVEEHAPEDVETIHIALVKLVAPETLDDETLRGVGQTLSQLSRLSMVPCVVLDTGSNPSDSGWRQMCSEQADRVVAAIDANPGPGARRLDNILAISAQNGTPEVFLRKLLLRPLRRGKIPVIVPMAYASETQKATQVTADETVLALTREFADLNLKPTLDEDTTQTAQRSRSLQKQVSLDRLIILDPQGGIPLDANSDRNHVFINMEQEFDDIRDELINRVEARSAVDSRAHLRNLELLRDSLLYLPPTSSALLTTPADAAKSSGSSHPSTQISGVGTRRTKNSLIHNLLTDKPAHSSSLPTGRLSKNGSSSGQSPLVASTFVKKGMPLTILPDPRINSWVADNHGQPRLTLTDPRIDLSRLTHLIDDSFNRKLDVKDYLNRVNDRIAGVIIAGEYEGGGILTWETPPGASDGDTSRLVPYLDKFAVLKRSQGAGGVADIVFNAMVRGCFPNGVCWRSRRDNPVNKWYFERARGTWKIPHTNWTMFWTTEGVVEHDQTFRDYEGVCRGVKPSWADNKLIVD